MSDPVTGLPDTPETLHVPWDDDPEELYQRAPCGYLSTLPDGTITKVNETFLSWTGFDRAALVGRRRLRDLLTAGSRIYHETHYAPLLRMQDELHEVAFDVVCADGRRLPTLVNSVLSRDADGHPRVIRTTVFNATERRSYERELLVARRAAEASERRVRALQRVVADLAAARTEAQVAASVVGAPVAVFEAAESCIWLVDTERRRLVPTSSAMADPGGPDAAGPDPGGPDPGGPDPGGPDPGGPDPGGPDPGGVDAGGPDPGGVGDEMIPLFSSAALAGVARRGELRVIGTVADVQDDDPALAQMMVRRGCSSMLALPLTAVTDAAGPTDDASVLGVLAFGFADLRTFTESELDAARLLGHQAGQALHRARLYDDARRREARATFLVETTRALDETHRLTPRVERLVARLVPEIVPWAAVHLLVGPAGIEVQAGGPVPAPAELAERIAELAPNVDVPAPPERTDPQLTGPQLTDPQLTVLPLTVRGRILGTLAVRLPADAPMDAGDAVFLRDLADRAALALENARLYEQERTIAQTLQRSLLAGDLPADDRFAVDTHYQPATDDLEVGGDWYDAFLISADKLAVVVGDVVGRGIDAATTMGQLRSAIRALASAEAGPARLLERLDAFVERVESARMATVVYGEVTLSSGELTYACAGHLPPLLLEPGDVPRFLWGGRSAPLGSRAGRTARTEEQVHMSPGSRLLLYTDGLVERRDRLLDVGLVSLADEFADRRDAPLPALTAGLVVDIVGPEHGDDVCLLCVALGTEERIERQIGADPGQIALLRKDLRGWLASHAVDEETRQAVLLASSEAAANAIEHGYRGDPYGVVTVTATVRPDAIEVRVADRGNWRPVPGGPGRGRGLQIMRQVMDDVDISSDGGTVVTMRRLRRGAGHG